MPECLEPINVLRDTMAKSGPGDMAPSKINRVMPKKVMSDIEVSMCAA